jgi:hypothetical protein
MIGILTIEWLLVDSCINGTQWVIKGTRPTIPSNGKGYITKKNIWWKILKRGEFCQTANSTYWVRGKQVDGVYQRMIVVCFEGITWRRATSMGRFGKKWKDKHTKDKQIKR